MLTKDLLGWKASKFVKFKENQAPFVSFLCLSESCYDWFHSFDGELKKKNVILFHWVIRLGHIVIIVYICLYLLDLLHVKFLYGSYA